jgi:hypothetical protein
LLKILTVGKDHGTDQSCQPLALANNRLSFPQVFNLGVRACAEKSRKVSYLKTKLLLVFIDFTLTTSAIKRIIHSTKKENANGKAQSVHRLRL